ncbi:Uncharacterised protein [Akkermansia muciniphila]|uniref:Uncharacterized protein n=1 Tax=Akkermansia muciniphila TaxID=239935 RepID=A0A6N2RVF1_9BACT
MQEYKKKYKLIPTSKFQANFMQLGSGQYQALKKLINLPPNIWVYMLMQDLG